MTHPHPLMISPGRLTFAMLVNAGLVVCLVGIGTTAALAIWQQGLLALLALLFLGLGWRQWQARGVTLHWTERGLETGEGVLLADIQNIIRVERGPFAFKPSNGFLVISSTSQGRQWEPGIYWRTGRRLGVGGLLNGAMTRQMADHIAIELAKRG